jgi:Dolichyl-phosphate-mannose-protein mannosyltransferase
MRLSWESDGPGRAGGEGSWRRGAVLAAATVALNAVFWLVVDRTATTHQHLTIVLEGPSVSATLEHFPTTAWDRAPQGNGRLGIAISARDSLGEAGIDHIVVKALPGKSLLVKDDFSRGAPAWMLPPSWRAHARRLLTAEPTVLWSKDVVCGDCAIELNVVNVRGLDVFLRTTDDKNGLLLRWFGESLAWHAVTNGEPGVAHSIVRYTLSERDLFNRFEAELALTLRRAYVDGWRFASWYGKAALPGLLLVALLAVVWRARPPGPPRWARRLGETRMGRRGVGAAVGSAVGVAAVAFARPWWPEGVLSRVTTLALASLGAGLVVLVVRELTRMQEVAPEGYRRLSTGATAVAVAALCAAAACYSAFAARVTLEGIPHVQDSVSYLMAAKAITTGHLKIPVEPELGPFFELPLFFEYHNGYLFPLVPGLYYAGHPALLALGQLFHAPWVVNPISSGLTLGLLFLLCRELFGTSTGVLAVALGAISPFARFQSASMMSHTSALLFVTAALLSLVYWLRRRRPVYAMFLGAAVGVLLNVRPFDATVLAAFIALVLLVRLRSIGVRTVLHMGGIAAAAFTPFVLLILCQTAALGGGMNPSARDLLQWLPGNIDATHLRLEDLNLHLFGWPVVPGLPPELTVGVLLLALLVMPKTRPDWFIAGWALLYVVAYLATCWHANMFGPRYWYCSLGGQLVLVARLLQILPGLVTRLCGVLWPPGKTPRWRWMAAAAGAVPMVVVAGPLFLGTVKALPEHFNPSWRGYNGFSAEPLRLLAEHGVKKGLVFVDEMPDWQHLVTCIAANDVSLAGDLIFARHLEGRDHVLIRARPDHPPYLITWNGTALELGRLRLDPATSEVTLLPMPSKHGDPRVIGEGNIYLGMALPRGSPLQGGLATDGRGNLYVVDSVDHEILVFDTSGILRRRVSAAYSFGPGAINAGQGIAVDAEGNVYVANFNPPGVVRLNADGTFAWRAQQTTDGGQRLTNPVGIAILPEGDLVVTNMDPPELHVLRRDGVLAGYYARGAARGELRRPCGVAVGSNRHLYVADAGLNALLEIDERGRAVRRWPLPLHEVRPFQVPYVAVDSRGHAYVSDFNGWALYHAGPDKPEVDVIGTAETLVDPTGVTVRDREVLVMKSGANRVLRYPIQ